MDNSITGEHSEPINPITITSTSSREQFFDHVSVHVGQPAVDAVVAERQPGVVDAQQVQDRGVQVVAVRLPGSGLAMPRGRFRRGTCRP